jgi:hypothetical protein
MGDLDEDQDIHSYLKTTANALPALIMMGSVPAVSNFLHLPWVAKRLFPTAEDKIGMGKLIGWVFSGSSTYRDVDIASSITQNMVRKCFASNASHEVRKMDILQSFIAHGLDEEETVAESLIQM